ncbi:T9SS type A sorting domain-containing protein [Flavobacterium tructae]|uniref:T9SS type A sorting domain-containing protein n=1 Tax=Flavobacterium tructae TaxID=1114873 RepID=UPI002551E6B3|nr:T9SS type A sorting domain-containing protein [Flavobacterium tructae]MDL2144405.1 T9SS type A sorting domain-containing protein [Flavobacterium tructae]
MRKNYLYVILFLFLTFTSFGQKVTITPTAVDNQNINTGPINLGNKSEARVSLGVTVEMPAIPGNNGTISIYSLNGLNANVVTGGNGGALFFGEGKIAVRSFVVTLNAGDFSTSSGSIYAEYKTFSGITYKSATISVIKNGVPPPNPPSSDSNTEIVPFGGTPLLPKFSSYYDVVHQDWVDIGRRVVKPNTPYYDPGSLWQRTFFNDGREVIGNQVSFYVVDFFTKLNDPKKIENSIGKSQYLQEGESPNTLTGNQGTVSSGTTTITINNYQWQSRTKEPLTWGNIKLYFYTYGWKDIPGATQMNYTPAKSDSALEYRRLLIEDPTNTFSLRRCAASNVIEVVPYENNPAKNSICCDQTISGNTPLNQLTGNTLYNATFQWLFSKDNINWAPILGATGQNYTPTSSNPETTYFQATHYYKRVLYDFANNKNYMSNVAQINFEVRPNNEAVLLFPNPATTLITLNTPGRIINNGIVIVDSTGNTVTPAEIIRRSPNMVHLDISNLRPGIYFLEASLSISGESRVDIYKTKFIKQ